MTATLEDLAREFAAREAALLKATSTVFTVLIHQLVDRGHIDPATLHRELRNCASAYSLLQTRSGADPADLEADRRETEAFGQLLEKLERRLFQPPG